MNAIEIKNLSYKQVFKNLTLNIPKNAHVTLMGKNGVGKSTLARLIIDGDKNIKTIDKVGLITSNPDKQIIGKTVREQLMFYMSDNLTEKQMKSRINKVIKDFTLKDIIDVDPFSLSNEKKQIIIILSYLISDFSILIFDNAMSFIGTYHKKKLFEYMKKKKRTIINITNDSEDILYGNYVAILMKNEIICKSLKEMLNEEKLFIDNNLKLPFIAELSLKLKYYDIVDNISLDGVEMVDKIWN